MTGGEREAFAARCVRTILAGQESTGAYLAAPSFAPYRFCWFRDSAFVADAMSRAGEAASAEAFFAWAERTLVPRLDAGEDPHTRYTADGRESPVEWPSFQLDGFGLLLWALARHRARHGGPERVKLRRLLAAYLAASWRRACTDWWEEQEGMHAATLGCIAAGLRAEDQPAAEDVLAALPLADWRLDASLVALATPLEVVRPEAVPLEELEARLVSPGGGVHRHPDDTYYGGGEWLLLTALLGEHYARLGRRAEAEAKLAWLVAHEREDGLPEQSQDHLLAPGRYDEWVARWGEPPHPLLWSSAMALDLALTLAE